MNYKLLFVTNNRHKLGEIQKLAGDRLRIISMNEAGISEDIPETGETLESNASLKSWYAYHKTGLNCFADDTGLETDALNGRPGVFSARYAGPDNDHIKNIEKVLSELQGIKNRRARFRTVISLIIDKQEYFFEGIAEGEILHECHGDKGFGYDPVFRPEGYECSFAEMDMDQKNRISHRGKAIQKLMEFLQENLHLQNPS
ncbi:MAG: non-canonical purine NTP diphosphatase [Bacteroidales bacterium]|nr:non-canonical purine NTP diphosphatase [Bacteroidales bacterium]